MGAAYNVRRRLTDQEVLAIRREYKAYRRSFGSKQGILTDLSNKYEVTPSAVYDIVNRRTYKHLGGY
jgi:Mor family transcriptional regulator